MSANLMIRRHPFSMEQGVLPVRSGQSLMAMLTEAAGGDFRPALRVEIGGHEVPRELWARVKPKAGTVIHVTAMPMGDNGKKILRTVLLIAVAVAAMWVTGGGAAPWLGSAFGAGTTGAMMLGAAVSIVGSLLVNALIPPPKPEAAGGWGDQERYNSITGTQNGFVPWGAIPFVVGESKVFPPHCAMPYSETIGDTQYQRCMFDLGHGEIDADYVLSTLKIGQTAISEYDDVEVEVTRTPTLYKDDVDETAVSASMNDSDDVTRTTAPNVEEISLDIIFPAGLFGVNSKGKTVQAVAAFGIYYRAVGASAWIPVNAALPTTHAHGFHYGLAGMANAPVSGNGRKPFAVGVAWAVTPGQYEVRVQRHATNWYTADGDSRIGDAQWGVLRSIRHTQASKTGTTKLVMRIKATDQLNGTLQTVNCIVRQKIPVYDPDTATWSAPTVNLNPAWVYHWLLTECPGVAVHVPPERMDLPSLVAFADYCETHDFQTRGVVDARTTMRQLMDDVVANALGAVSCRDGRYGVLFDNGSTLPTMVFTPHDMANFRASRPFLRLPHALKVRFRNPEAFWEDDEITVLDDGYSYRGVDARGNPSTDPEPTEFETLDLRYVCDSRNAWQVGRAHLAQAKFRPNVFEWDTDIANLSCTRGDCVDVAHDVADWGYGWGRVAEVRTTNLPAGFAAAIVLDNLVETEVGKSYSLQLRSATGTSTVIPVTPHSPETNTFYAATVPAAEYGDVAVVGETTRVTEKLLITGIIPTADLGATMRAVQYDARVAAFWANPPEVIVSDITGTSYRDKPGDPTVGDVVNNPDNDDDDDAGIKDPGVTIPIRRPDDGRFHPPMEER